MESLKDMPTYSIRIMKLSYFRKERENGEIMGQRSQIYIRYNVNYISRAATPNPITHNYKGLIARYYGWNYGERMISRARCIVEEIEDVFMKYKYYFNDEEKLEKLIRICDTNFDMKDIMFSSDIIREVKDDVDGDLQYLFNQDNNNGQLFIDVTDDGIKYCFMKFYNEGEPMDGEGYMKWTYEDEKYQNWHTPSEYMNRKTIAYTERNIKNLSKIATLMTSEDLKSFVEDDYTYLLTSVS